MCFLMASCAVCTDERINGGHDDTSAMIITIESPSQIQIAEYLEYLYPARKEQRRKEGSSQGKRRSKPKQEGGEELLPLVMEIGLLDAIRCRKFLTLFDDLALRFPTITITQKAYIRQVLSSTPPSSSPLPNYRRLALYLSPKPLAQHGPPT
jgi:hypothetical protein